MTARELSDRLLREFPESRPNLTEFPSGDFMIDIEVNGVQFVAEYVVGKGFGFSKTQEATFGWEGVEQSFATIEGLADHIFKELGQKHS